MKKTSFLNFQTEKPLKLINSGDFIVPKVIEEINDHFYYSYHDKLCKLLPSTDPLEIIERQNIIKVILENKELTEWVSHEILNEHINHSLPTEGNEFLAYFHPSNEKAFWKKIRKFKNILEKSETSFAGSKSLKDLYQKISDLLNQQEKIENDFYEKVKNELKKLLQIQGSLRIKLSKDNFPIVDKEITFNSEKYYGLVLDSVCYGWKKYSFMYAQSSISPGLIESIPYYMEKNWLRRIVFFKQINKIKKHNLEVEKRRLELKKSIDFSTEIISGNVPKSILEDIKIWVYEKFQKQFGRKDSFIKMIDENSDLILQLVFLLNNEGLFVTIADAYVVDEKKNKEVDGRLFWEEQTFPGYPQSSYDYILTRYNEFKKKVFIRTFVKSENFLLYNYLQRRMHNLTNELTKIDSKNSRKGIIITTFEKIINAPGFKEELGLISSLRNDLWKDLSNLSHYVEIASAFVKYANGLGKVVYTFPEILTDTKHLISFESLTPLSLIGRTKFFKGKEKTIKFSDLIAIKSIGHLDGSIVCLTGQNAGGKTTTMEELMGCVYQAQCGLPIFGEGFVLNPKEVLAMVFLERGNHSTLELLYNKTKAMLEAVVENNEDKIMVFMDELGSATQETSGFDFGKDLLTKLKEHGCSVVMSTQIIELAKYVDQIGGRCYQFDINHRMKPGIGTGNAELLRKKIGLDKLLK